MLVLSVPQVCVYYNARMSTLTPTQKLLKETFDTARKGLYIVVLFSFCINFLMLAAPIYMLQIFDRVLSSRSTDTLLLLTVIIGIAILTMASLEAQPAHPVVCWGWATPSPPPE